MKVIDPPETISAPMGNDQSCLGRRRPPRPPEWISHDRGVTEEDVQQLEAFTGAARDACRRVLTDCGGDLNSAAGRLLLSGGLELMSMELPQDAQSGDNVHVLTPRGLCSVCVPTGYRGGDTLTFQLPRGPLPIAVAHEVETSFSNAADPHESPVDPELPPRYVRDGVLGPRNATNSLSEDNGAPPHEGSGSEGDDTEGDGAERVSASHAERVRQGSIPVAVPLPASPHVRTAMIHSAVHVDPRYMRYRDHPYYYDPVLPMAGGFLLGSMLFPWPFLFY